MSDEAARRRELRKQRILGNSENRLKRILNKEEQTTNLNSINDDSELTERDGGVSPILSRTTEVPPHVSTPLISDLANELNSAIDFPDLASLAMFGSGSNRETDPLFARPPFDMNDLNDTEDPMELICRLAAKLEGTKCDAPPQQLSYEGPALLIDSGNASRVRSIFLLGIVSRLLLPSLPAEYAKLYAPLYLLEVLLFSLCLVYKAPLQHSSMSFAYGLMSLCGVHSIIVKMAQIFSTCLGLILRDIRCYSFSFFITHALCQQLEIFNV